MLDRKSIMKKIHEYAQKVFKGIFRFGKSYRQILGEQISEYWRVLKINAKMSVMSVEEIDDFYSNSKAII